MAGKQWTKEEHQLLEAFIERDLPYKDIAEQMGRTIHAVELKARKIGLGHNQPKRDFTIQEVPSGELELADLLAINRKQFLARQEQKEVTKLLPIDIHIDGPIGIAIFGDPHLDDDNTDVGMIEDHIRIVKQTPGMLAMCAGDYTNNWVGRLEKLYAKQMTTRTQASMLIEWFFKSLPWLMLVGGNHDAWNDGHSVLKLIGRITNSHYQKHGGRYELRFPNGQSCRLNARHDFKGRSWFSPSFGPNKAAIAGDRDHVYVCGHLHDDGYQTQRISGVRTHAIRVGAYKRFDEFAVENGFTEDDSSPCYVIVIDPSQKQTDDGFITVFTDLEKGAQYLTLLREKAA